MARVWLVIEESEDGQLVAYGNGGKNGHAGQPLVTYRRTEPANPARVSAWGEELSTDIQAVARTAVRVMLKADPEQAVRSGEAASPAASQAVMRSGEAASHPASPGAAR